MTERLIRIDYACRFVLDADDDTDVDADAGTARWTPEGYLEVDAYLARDGYLTYSDGSTSWIEYRPREELVAAAASWATAPVTDDHPKKMVDASTWSQVARGMHVTTPTVVGPFDAGGVSYLSARLLITDADLLKAIDKGKRELSIGFTSEVEPVDHPEYQAVQRALIGNHTAVVDRGRAGPTVRILMDGATVPTSGPHMTIKNVKPKSKADAVGMPVESVEIVGPDGMPVALPTWVAAQLEELAAMKAAAVQPPQPAAPVEPAAPAPAAPVDTVVAAAEPAPAAAAPAVAPEEEEDEDEETKDSVDVSVLVRRRAKLERLAVKAGIPDARIDSADDGQLAREFIATRLPALKLDGFNAVQLDALVAAAESLEAPAKRNDNAPVTPWQVPTPVARDTADSVDPEIAAYLKGQGY